MGQRPKVSRGSGSPLIKRPALQIGVITDTHGLYDPAVDRHFAAVQEILHAGDIGGAHVIDRLRRLAPVTAVSGNVDDFEASGFPRRLVLRRSGLKIALCHVLVENGKISPATAAWLDQASPDVCVFGHSHRPMVAWQGRTLFVNPGSAGPRRFSLPRGIAILTIEAAGMPAARLIRLDDRVGGAASGGRTSARAKGVR